MDLFGGIFDEDATSSKGKNETVQSAKDIPEAARYSHGLCGIYNQGATCYLNSLLQSLLMTPEFRESLFQIPQSQLGKLENKDKANAKVRVIPLELRMLFSRLLHLDVAAVSTQSLTDSFGWTDNEQLIQHDVQELNRILFSAIEDSLVGTAGESLIRDLYHGASVNQIICQACGNVSQREEDFLDLCLAVGENNSVEDALYSSFVAYEILDGKNQYFCDKCNKLVDAKKGARLRHLPPILTLSLLRFSFDFIKLERYKETGKFSFPQSINMAKYLEETSPVGDTEYELFSVVIHRGSTHGGHYHAYIRDVDCLAKDWTDPDDSVIRIPPDPALSGKTDYIECSSPVELVQMILSRVSNNQGMPVDKLGAEIMKQTGVSWNKRFKSKYGPVNKFLKKYDDKFEMNTSTNMVWLKEHNHETDQNNEIDTKTQQNRTPPPPGERWFDFDDARITGIRSTDLEKQFSGKESAYMLFYRSKCLTRSPTHCASSYIPTDIVESICLENEQLQLKRLEYEIEMNTMTIHVYFATMFNFTKGALHSDCDPCFIDITIDQRKSIEELRLSIIEAGSELIQSEFVVHKLCELPGGWHIYNWVDQDYNINISKQLRHDDKVLVWDGKQIGGHCDIPCGIHTEPVLLHITDGKSINFTHAYRSSLTFGELKFHLEELIGMAAEHMQLSRVIKKGDTTQVIKLLQDEMERTLKEMNVDNGDAILCEDGRHSTGNLGNYAINTSDLHMTVMIENRCLPALKGDGHPVTSVSIEKDSSVGELKALIMSTLSDDSVKEGGRLRLDHDDLGLRCPIQEEQSLTEAGIKQGSRVVLEHGKAPTSSQITLLCTVDWPNIKKDQCRDDSNELEVTVDRSASIYDCLVIIANRAKVSAADWHLRRTNWCGEAGSVLDDLAASVESEELRDGSHLLLVPGVLPPKDHIKLPVYLLASPQGNDESGIMSWITNGVKDMLSSGGAAAAEASNGEIGDDTRLVGDIIVSKVATLYELKMQVLSLPGMPELPTPGFLRLRLIENGRPTTVLRGANLTLQRMKVLSSSKIGAQILQHEEFLSPSHIVLTLRLRDPQTRSYPGNPLELIWPASPATVFSLRQAAADAFALPVENIAIAKHLPDKYEWLPIKEGRAQPTKKKKGGNKQMSNVKAAPFNVKDGDVIGVKNLEFEAPCDTDDFSTPDDEDGKEQQKQEILEKKNRRLANRRGATFDVGGAGDTTGGTQRRAEVGIKIHVADFTS